MFVIQDTKLSFCNSDRTIFLAFWTLPYTICHTQRVPTSTRMTTGGKSSFETVIETRYGALQNNLLYYDKTHTSCQKLLSSHRKFAKWLCRRWAVPAPCTIQLCSSWSREPRLRPGAGQELGWLQRDNLPWLWFSLYPSDFSLPGFQSYFWAWWRVNLSFAARKVAVTILTAFVRDTWGGLMEWFLGSFIFPHDFRSKRILSRNILSGDVRSAKLQQEKHHF